MEALYNTIIEVGDLSNQIGHHGKMKKIPLDSIQLASVTIMNKD